jgi:hypothetical protein
MRARRLNIFFAFLLLIAQHGALAHAISHATSQTQREQSLLHSQVCDECVCYGSSSAAAHPKVTIFEAASFAQAPAFDAGHSHTPFFLRAFASRAPPTLL